MDERPWWIYGLEITFLACLIPLLMFAGAYAQGGTGSLPISASTVNLVLSVTGMCSGLIVIVIYCRDGSTGLWSFFCDLLDIFTSIIFVGPWRLLRGGVLLMAWTLRGVD